MPGVVLDHISKHFGSVAAVKDFQTIIYVTNDQVEAMTMGSKIHITVAAGEQGPIAPEK